MHSSTLSGTLKASYGEGIACLNRTACVSGLLLAPAYSPRSIATARVLARLLLHVPITNITMHVCYSVYYTNDAYTMHACYSVYYTNGRIYCI